MNREVCWKCRSKLVGDTVLSSMPDASEGERNRMISIGVANIRKIINGSVDEWYCPGNHETVCDKTDVFDGCLFSLEQTVSNQKENT